MALLKHGNSVRMISLNTEGETGPTDQTQWSAAFIYTYSSTTKDKMMSLIFLDQLVLDKLI